MKSFSRYLKEAVDPKCFVLSYTPSSLEGIYFESTSDAPGVVRAWTTQEQAWKYAQAMYNDQKLFFTPNITHIVTTTPAYLERLRADPSNPIKHISYENSVL